MPPVAREDVATAGAQRHVPIGELSGAALPPVELTRALLEFALELGFASAGVLPLERFDEAEKRFEGYIAEGRHGDMAYLVTGGDRADPRLLLPEARSAIVVALPHPANARNEVTLRRSRQEGAIDASSDCAEPPRGRVAKYARGNDYHTVLKGLLLKLADECARLVKRPVVARACIDTAPLLEREAATRAGLGFVGKNTMAIVPGVGSYVMLGELFLDVVLTPQSLRQGAARVVSTDGCGKCTLCLDACPTDAFLGPYQLDARRCISYLTIEQTGAVPRELRAPIGAHVFGCDVCQDVCPFNQTAHKKPAAADFAPRPHLAAPELTDVLELTSAGYRKFVRGTALKRTHRAHLARNAAIALGNCDDQAAIQPLTQALASHPSALVRGHAAWALGRLAAFDQDLVVDALTRALDDDDAFVREEAAAALRDIEAR